MTVLPQKRFYQKIVLLICYSVIPVIATEPTNNQKEDVDTRLWLKETMMDLHNLELSDGILSIIFDHIENPDITFYVIATIKIPYPNQDLAAGYHYLEDNGCYQVKITGKSHKSNQRKTLEAIYATTYNRQEISEITSDCKLVNYESQEINIPRTIIKKLNFRPEMCDAVYAEMAIDEYFGKRHMGIVVEGQPIRNIGNNAVYIHMNPCFYNCMRYQKPLKKHDYIIEGSGCLVTTSNSFFTQAQKLTLWGFCEQRRKFSSMNWPIRTPLGTTYPNQLDMIFSILALPFCLYWVMFTPYITECSQKTGPQLRPCLVIMIAFTLGITIGAADRLNNTGLANLVIYVSLYLSSFYELTWKQWNQQRSGDTCYFT
ncbi:MAG: hypothetical protein ACPGC9_00955 [Cytophagales bacterium]